MSQKVLDAAPKSFTFVWNALTHWKLFSLPTFLSFTAVQELRGEMDIDNEHWTATSRYRKDKGRWMTADLRFVKKNYTTGFQGQKFYILKVRKLQLFLLKKKQRKCIDISYFSSLFARIWLSV